MPRRIERQDCRWCTMSLARSRGRRYAAEERERILAVVSVAVS
jgi:hypothetical protein